MTVKRSVQNSDDLRLPWNRLDGPPTDLLPQSDSSGLLLSAIDTVPIMVFTIDSKGVFSLAEGGGLRGLGVSPDQLIGKRFLELFKDTPENEEFLFRAFGGQRGSARFEVRGRILEIWHSPVCDADGDTVGVTGVALDVTEHERADERLRAGQRHMEQLLQSLERDHQLIAYEIHDGLVQDATGAQMQLSALLENTLLPDAIRNQVQLAADLIAKSISQARELISGLRPPILDEHGVVAAIAYLAENRQIDGPSIELTADVRFDRLEPLLETTVYRIVQEAVANLRHHSRSERGEIRLQQIGERLHIEIKDWGVGFDPSNVAIDRFGLQGIRERARLLRGRAVIISEPGRGTRVFVDLPVVPALENVACARSWSVE